MKNNTKRTILLGVICVLFAAAASWYTIVFNDARFVASMDFSEYVFRVQDLPMIISGIFLAAYVLYLLVQLARAIAVQKGKKKREQSTRVVNPKLGFLGFLGFAGFLGFLSYSTDKTIFPFVFFTFFGFFGFFYEGKMSHTFMDERYKENQRKAHLAANQTAIAIDFLALLVLGQRPIMGNLEYNLIALITVVSLSIALEVFLYEYLLYRYDHDEPDESGE